MDLTNNYRRAVFVATPIIFYGTIVAGAARMMNWEPVCPCSH